MTIRVDSSKKLVVSHFDVCANSSPWIRGQRAKEGRCSPDYDSQGPELSAAPSSDQRLTSRQLDTFPALCHQVVCHHLLITVLISVYQCLPSVCDRLIGTFTQLAHELSLAVA